MHCSDLMFLSNGSDVLFLACCVSYSQTWMIDTPAKSFAMQLFYAAAYFSAKSNITHTRYHDGIISNYITMAIFSLKDSYKKCSRIKY